MSDAAHRTPRDGPATSAASPWWKHGVIYQIYVRSFADSNGDGVGDLRGIEAHLDYLAGSHDSLGVDAIWLTPFYRTPDRDFGYDVSDFRDVDPRFGNLEDFDSLLEAAHARGIRVILDFVPNHTSDQHPWFRASRESRDNPYRDWYIWREGRGRRPPNRWRAVPGGSAWSWDEQTRQYFYHAFLDFQPDLNWRNPEVRKAIMGDMAFWLDRGVDGFRLDLVNHLIEDDALRDNPRWWAGPFQESRHTRNHPETHAAIAELRALTDRYADRMMVGEIVSMPWERSPAHEYTHDRELHTAFDLSLPAQIRFSASVWARIIDAFERDTGSGWPAYTLSNHDVPRHMGRLGGHLFYGYGRHAWARARVAAAFLLTVRGTPFLYYGEELGMTNRWWPRREICDPMGRPWWPLYQGRDAARTPMLWNGNPGAGFSSAKPWLPVDPDAEALNVEAARAHPGSLWNFYRAILALRRATPPLHSGSYERLEGTPRAVFAFRRQHQDQEVWVALNFSGRPRTIEPVSPGRRLLSTAAGKNSIGRRVELEPHGVLVVESA